MKKRLFILLAAIGMMALLPFFSVTGSSDSTGSPTDSSSETEREPQISGTTDGKFRILDTSSGKIITVSDKEFCVGALAYEMSRGYEEEALKAQCVACYTHFCRLRRQKRSEAGESWQGEDFQADLSTGQYYLNNECLQKRWGSQYNELRKKMEKVVEDCFGLVLMDDNGELLDVGYFAISSGKTEAAADIFGFDSPHLQAVISPFDKSAPDACTVVRLSSEEFKNKLSERFPDLSLEAPPSTWIGDCQRTASGSVITIDIGEQTISGPAVRECFDLRSANFELSIQKEQFCFRVYGYGHGVGLSQYGANGMAMQGADFREILDHYYSQAPIVSLES